MGNRNFLKTGSILPEGWILEQMSHDLRDGFVGHLDELVPALIREDDIYGRDRLTKQVRSKNVGAIAQDQEWEVQYLWWNSETQSNWRDGFLRHAVLTQNPEYLRKAEEYVEEMLAKQDPDGYFGIYGEDLRYRFDGENGELWAQATLLRGLLGYYEARGDERVLRAVIRAVERTMQAYPAGASAPFLADSSYAGLCHGLAFVDVLEKLYEITGREAYTAYAVWLYEDYSKHSLTETDVQLPNLLDGEYRFQGHGAHTYEHLRAVILAAYESDRPVYREALAGYLRKLDRCLCPGGGPIGDEWIFGHTADPSLHGYEYCSLTELLISYSLLLMKSGELQWADRIEWLLFNDAQGARHPEESAIAYLKSDNSYAMEGHFQTEQSWVTNPVQTRYEYSPTHQDAAVCCVPNAGRIYPYYVQSMWLRDEEGVTAALYGPCSVQLEMTGTSGQKVRMTLEEQTQYPFDDSIHILVNADQPALFRIAFRRPAWCEDFSAAAPGAELTAGADRVSLRKLWQNGDSIEIRMRNRVRRHNDLQGDVFYSYGPLVYALPLPGREKVVKEFGFGGFRELQYAGMVDADYAAPADPDEKAVIRRLPFSVHRPWNGSLEL